MRFFLDTYAMVEIIRGNKAYEKYLSHELFTSILHLYEFYYDLIKNYPSEEAKQLYLKFLDCMIPIKNEHVFNAAQFKLLHHQKGISYADALGYVMAIQENMKFLTGDKEFKEMKNIEFVK